MPIPLYKKVGETPLEALHRLRQEKPEYKDAILSYAGRLDPLAEGVMLVLVDDENKEREKYLHLDKEYEVGVLFGVATDTHDVLGLMTSTSQIPEDLEEQVTNILPQFTGKKQQPYPVFSSKTVGGVPLFQLAKDNAVPETIPSREVTIYRIETLGWRSISLNELSTKVIELIEKVKGDFRQEEIKQSWNEFCNTTKEREFRILSIRVACSSGTYMRSLAHELGKSLGCGALALKILRTQVGEETINGLVR